MGYENEFPDESHEGQSYERKNNWNNGPNGGSGYSGNSNSGGFRGNNFNGGQRGNYGRSNYGKGNNSGYNRGQNGGFRKSNYANNEEQDDGIVLYKSYVITGNKEIPSDVTAAIKRIAGELEEFGFIVRLSAMDGIETEVESAVKKKELHLPWRGFNGRESRSYFNTKRAFEIAKMFHPAYDGLKQSIQAILAKNARLVSGKDLNSPCMFILCWSEDGAENNKEKTVKTGNIGHVIAIASALKIPVFNFGKPGAEARLKSYLELPEKSYMESPNE